MRGGIQIPIFLLKGILEKGIGLHGLVMVFLIVPLELMWRIVCRLHFFFDGVMADSFVDQLPVIVREAAC